MDKRTIISISRQYGSGGREVAQLLAKKTGFHLYDRQIIDSAAKELGISNSTEEQLKALETSEPAPLGFIPFYSIGADEGPSDTSMFVAESKIIRQLAKAGSCIILGRCGDFVLRDFSKHYSFFICADDDFRTERGRTEYEGKSLQEIKAEDQKRADYYEYYTGERWGQPEKYSLSINASKISLDKAADLIIRYVELLQA